MTERKRYTFSIPSLGGYNRKGNDKISQEKKWTDIESSEKREVDHVTDENQLPTSTKSRSARSLSMTELYKKVTSLKPTRKTKTTIVEENITLSAFKVGHPVVTLYGTGMLVEIRPSTHTFIVKLGFAGIGYFHRDAILREVKAMVGDRVRTDYGMGTVEDYRTEEDLYEIALDWRWDDDHIWRMKATAEKIERVAHKISLYKKTTGYFSGFKTTTSNSLSSMRASTTEGLHSVKNKLSEMAISSRHRASVLEEEEESNIFTPFGEGCLAEIRDDHVHVAKIHGAGIAYLQPSSIVYHECKDSKSAIGDHIKTAYGMGVIGHHRTSDDIYEVRLEWGSTLYITGSVLALGMVRGEKRFSSFLNMTNSALKTIQSTTSSKYATVSGSYAVMKAKFASIKSTTKKASAFKVGERLVTPFGSGFLVQTRSDNILVIRLRRARAVVYIQPHRVLPFPYDKATLPAKTVPPPEAKKVTRNVILSKVIHK